MMGERAAAVSEARAAALARARASLGDLSTAGGAEDEDEESLAPLSLVSLGEAKWHLLVVVRRTA